MCGIIGLCFSGSNSRLGELLYRGLLRLEYRGYDSAGIAVLARDGVVVLKGKGKLMELESRLKFTQLAGSLGIGHTRWATHGPPTDENAHPHSDCNGLFTVVHNGIIENYHELKQQLLRKGHVFRSQTDTEVIPHLVEEFYSIYRDVYTAFKEAVKALKGAYAILMITPLESNKLFFAKKDSPLVVGFANDYNIVASDIPALLDHTRKVLVLRDNWVGYITPREVYVEDLTTGGIVEYEKLVRIVEWSMEVAEKEGYEHFMLKEIFEQPRSLRNTLAGLRSDWAVEEAVEILESAERVYITGAGTSYHASEFFALALYDLLGELVVPFIASEGELYSRTAGKGDVLIAVSQSGETMDVLKTVRKFKEKGARVIAVSNVVDSAIPRESDIAIYTRASPEIGVAATKTFTAQVLALSMLIAEIMKRRSVPKQEINEVLMAIENSPELVEESLEVNKGKARELAKILANTKSIYYLSRGVGLPIAREGALKIKEIAYIHAEAYPAGESKHGPIALVEPGFPVVFVVPPEPVLESMMLNNVMEMKARGALTIGVVYKGCRIAGVFDYVMEVPRAHRVVSPITHTPPLQLLAYYVAVEKGLDPDKPRNLAKTVTVE
ncbi:MAG: glutamine--fructose-6-phosphate transaminase (isomerizing) [Desulfurococcaceae archaeon]